MEYTNDTYDYCRFGDEAPMVHDEVPVAKPKVDKKGKDDQKQEDQLANEGNQNHDPESN